MEFGKDKNINKINSLLNFYFKEKVRICLKTKLFNSFLIRGMIIKKNFLGEKYVIIKHELKAPIKIFLSDIEDNSIIPTDWEKKENKNKRQSLPPQLRHKILKRDRYTCQSCGARAPEVELEIDHKIPVSKGGTDDENNLITLCKDCNTGKANKV